MHNSRVAQLVVEKKGTSRSLVTAYCPANITGQEFGSLQKTLIDKIIKDLTGCACLSGAVDVIFREDLRDVIKVNL